MASHKTLSNWYAQLGQHLEAGVMLADALRLCEGTPKRGRSEMADAVEAGISFSDVMASSPKWIPKADRQFMLAGMETGSLPQTLSNLSTRHASIGATKLKVVLGMTYPIAVLHVAILLYPLVQMIDSKTGLNWSLNVYLFQVGSKLLPLWAVLGVIGVLAKKQSPWLHKLLRVIPFLRKYSHAQATADLAYSLGTFIAAGVPVPSAWRLSAKMVSDRRFTKAVQSMEPLFAAEQDPTPTLKAFQCFPSDFVAFYTTGAQSGQLDKNLLIAARQYQDQANRAMTVASMVYPSLVFAGVALIAIMTIFQVFGGYLEIFETISD